MSGWNTGYVSKKKEVKIAGSCLSLKLHSLLGVTCLVLRQAWFSFNVNLTHSEGPCVHSGTSAGLHGNCSALLSE